MIFNHQLHSPFFFRSDSTCAKCSTAGPSGIRWTLWECERVWKGRLKWSVKEAKGYAGEDLLYNRIIRHTINTWWGEKEKKHHLCQYCLYTQHVPASFEVACISLHTWSGWKEWGWKVWPSLFWLCPSPFRGALKPSLWWWWWFLLLRWWNPYCSCRLILLLCHLLPFVLVLVSRIHIDKIDSEEQILVPKYGNEVMCACVAIGWDVYMSIGCGV